MKAGKVYVSGATGFIGSWVIKNLIQKGYDVRVSVRPSSNTENIKKYVAEGKIEVFEGDLEEPDFARKCVKGCDAVIHLAGWVNVSLNPKLKDRIIRANYNTAKNVLSASYHEDRIKKVVFLGSIFGLGKGEGREIADEQVEYNLWGLASKIPYIKAKRMSEEIADEFSEKGLPITRVYPNFCLGEGDIYLSSSKTIFPYVVPGGMKFYFDMGINVQWVGDAGKSLVLALERGKNGEKYLVGGENLFMKEVADISSRFAGNPPPKYKIDPVVFRPLLLAPPYLLYRVEKYVRKFGLDAGMLLISSYKYWFYSDDKARKELRYRSKSAESTIQEATKWILNNLSKFLKKS